MSDNKHVDSRKLRHHAKTVSLKLIVQLDSAIDSDYHIQFQ